MNSSVDSSDDSENPATIGMPAPVDPVQRQIAALEAMVAGYRTAGYSGDVEVKFTPNEFGSFDTTITGSISPEQMEKIARILTVKLHDPDKPSQKLRAEINDKPIVDWLDSERERCDKSKKTDVASPTPKTR